MKSGADARDTIENASVRTKHENGTRRTRNRRKRVRACKTRKLDPTPSIPPKTIPGTQNVKTVPDALGTVENESESAKLENGTRRPWYRRKYENENGRPWYHRKRVRERKTRKLDTTPPMSPKTIPGTQNVKTGPDALGTAENESRSAKREKGTLRHRYH
jgi:hypothetical protein